MRPSRLVVGSVLTAALALVALPGLAGSRAPRSLDPLPVSAFQPLPDTGINARQPLIVDGLDASAAGAGAVSAETSFIEPGVAPSTSPTKRTKVDQPDGVAGSALKPPKYKLTGTASFYTGGHTAMRLPRGTTVIVCGGAGCIERVIDDYGPQSANRIIDLDKGDFFKICGCASWSGLTKVTISVY
jgi:hypothetical protein